MSVTCATITLTRSPWIIVAVGTWMVALVLLLWSYRRVPDWGLGQKCAFALKLLGLLILVLCLIEPLWSSRRARPGANVVAVVADNSQGMTILDPGWHQRRSDVEQSYLAGDKAGWLGTLEEQFKVRRYRFDNRLHRSVDFNELKFDGPSSSLQTSLKTLAARYHGRPLAGIVLLTDGNPTDLDSGSLDTEGLPPVYPVVMGSDRGPRDLALTQVTVTQTAFEDAPVTIKASASATGWAGRMVNVAVRDQQGVLVQQQPWKVRQDTEHQVFRFRLRPTKSGVLFYRVTLSAEGQDLDEATRANNQRSVVVDRGQGPYRVLYVAGRPNWEYKFLHRAVSEDQQVNLVGLIRVAKREPKYDWRGRQGEQSNPLYRGSKQVDMEQTEQYDQPVIVRLNTRDKHELSGGFPKQA